MLIFDPQTIRVVKADPERLLLSTISKTHTLQKRTIFVGQRISPIILIAQESNLK